MSMRGEARKLEIALNILNAVLREVDKPSPTVFHDSGASKEARELRTVIRDNHEDAQYALQSAGESFRIPIYSKAFTAHDSVTALADFVTAAVNIQESLAHHIGKKGSKSAKAYLVEGKLPKNKTPADVATEFAALLLSKAGKNADILGAQQQTTTLFNTLAEAQRKGLSPTEADKVVQQLLIRACNISEPLTLDDAQRTRMQHLCHAVFEYAYNKAHPTVLPEAQYISDLLQALSQTISESEYGFNTPGVFRQQGNDQRKAQIKQRITARGPFALQDMALATIHDLSTLAKTALRESKTALPMMRAKQIQSQDARHAATALIGHITGTEIIAGPALEEYAESVVNALMAPTENVNIQLLQEALSTIVTIGINIVNGDGNPKIDSGGLARMLKESLFNAVGSLPEPKASDDIQAINARGEAATLALISAIGQRANLSLDANAAALDDGPPELEAIEEDDDVAVVLTEAAAPITPARDTEEKPKRPRRPSSEVLAQLKEDEENSNSTNGPKPL